MNIKFLKIQFAFFLVILFSSFVFACDYTVEDDRTFELDRVRYRGISQTICGNSIINENEVCDKTNLSGETCVSQGFDGGILSCNSNCLSYNTNNCYYMLPLGSNVGCNEIAVKGLAHLALVERGMPNISQHTNGTTNDNLGNNSCGSASLGSIIKKGSEEIPGLDKNFTNDHLVEVLRNLTNTTRNGTYSGNIINGFFLFIGNYSKNFTVKWYYYFNLTGPLKFKSITGDNVQGYERTRISPTDIQTEFVVGEENIIVHVNSTTYNYLHFMALDDYDTRANSDNTHNISFMDPWGNGSPGTTNKVYGKIDQNGNIRTSDGVNSEDLIMDEMIVISKK